MKRPPTDKLAELYFQKNLSPGEIAAREGGISATGVRSRLVRAGYKLRSRGGQKGRFKHPEISTEAVLARLQRNPNKSQLARELHVGRGTIAYRQKVAGVYEPKFKRGVMARLQEDPATCGQIIRWYEDDQSPAKIVEKLAARRMKASTQTIYRFLRSQGVEMHDKTAHLKPAWTELKKRAASAEIIDELQHQREDFRHLALTWMVWPTLSRAEAQRLAGTELSPATVTRVRGVVKRFLEAVRGDPKNKSMLISPKTDVQVPAE